jgi:hypothetical protein
MTASNFLFYLKGYMAALECAGIAIDKEHREVILNALNQAMKGEHDEQKDKSNRIYTEL